VPTHLRGRLHHAQGHRGQERCGAQWQENKVLWLTRDAFLFWAHFDRTGQLLKQLFQLQRSQSGRRAVSGDEACVVS